jgi:ABC-2 type transport system ATP-binding protein
VGDAAFQAKCFAKLLEIKAAGTTIVIVSHALGSIEQICERSYWIKDGIFEKTGIPADVHAEYMRFMAGKQAL